MKTFRYTKANTALTVDAVITGGSLNGGAFAVDTACSPAKLIIERKALFEEPDGNNDRLNAAAGALLSAVLQKGYKHIVLDVPSFSQKAGSAEGMTYIYNQLVDALLDSAQGSGAKLDGLELYVDLPEFSATGELNKALDGIRNGKNAINTSFGDRDDPLEEEFNRFKSKFAREKTFREYLLLLIDQKGYKKYSLFYKVAGISRYTFSKLTNFNINPPHKPRKDTVAALTIGLRLTVEEAEDFYSVAGYSLGKTDLSDLLIRFFIEKEIYDIDEVNYAFYYCGLPLLGENTREPKR